jgi:hypothetical protein
LACTFTRWCWESRDLAGRIGRLGCDGGAAAAEDLERCLLALDQWHDEVAVLRRLLLDHDDVAAADSRLDHRVDDGKPAGKTDLPAFPTAKGRRPGMCCALDTILVRVDDAGTIVIGRPGGT